MEFFLSHRNFECMKKLVLGFIFSLGTLAAFSQVNIGTTTYDVQTNNGAKHRLHVYPDGTISAMWTGSTDFTGTFPDRGMFYQHYDGAAWLAAPTARVEDLRVGFGEFLHVGDHEVSLSHNAPDGINFTLRLFANDAVGSSTFTELGGSNQAVGLWPTAFCPEGTDDIYVVCSNAQTVTNLFFSRSDDGGETWSVLNDTVPFLTAADGFPDLFNAAEDYQIAVHGSDVYILFGMVNSDLVLIHSADNGNPGTWESTPIIDFPFDNYTGAVQTDVDGDGITDTVNTSDGYHNMIIEDDGTVQIFTPLYRIYSDLGAGFYTINWRTMGMWHWKTGMPAAEIIDTEMDWVNDLCDADPYAGIGANTINYRQAAPVTSPGAAWDPVSGRIYLLYTMKIEYTDIFDDPTNLSAQSFHDIFGMYSDDDGATWSQPVNITNTADDGEENFYVFVNDRVVGGKVHAIWQQDNEPGHFNEGDPIVTNNIKYMALDAESFNPTLPTADFVGVDGGGSIDFTNFSTNAWLCYAWDFGDGTTSTEINPSHAYATAGTYTVCLTASNPYGSDTYCDDVTLALAPDAAFTYTGDPVVSFTDLTLNDPTSWSWDFGDGSNSTLQNPVHTFTADATYTVCLTATNALGFNVYCLPVVIDSTALLIPAADFSYSFTGLTGTFTDLSTNTPTSWAWDFGDGGTSTVQNPSHAFAVDGDYNVCLTASNAYGSNTGCKVVSTTGIDPMQLELTAVYPNPAHNMVTIQSAGWTAENITLINMIGEKMNVPFSQQNGTILISVNDVPAGNYIISLQTKETELHGQIVIE